MSDLREELGRLADEVGEPVTFRELEVTRRRRERRRRVEGLLVGLAIAAAAAIFLSTTLTDRTDVGPSPGHSVTSSTRSRAPDSCGSGPGPVRVAEVATGGKGVDLIGCSIWPADKAFRMRFESTPSRSVRLRLVPWGTCAEGSWCANAVWTTPYEHSGRQIYVVPPLHPGRYLLIDFERQLRLEIIVR